jgi:hypothetical protein
VLLSYTIIGKYSLELLSRCTTCRWQCNDLYIDIFKNVCFEAKIVKYICLCINRKKKLRSLKIISYVDTTPSRLLCIFAFSKLCSKICISRKYSTYKKKGKGKGKAIPLLTWKGPESSRRLRLPDFKTIGT